MSIFKTLSILAVLALALALAGGAFVYSGAYDVAADQPHWTITHRLIAILRDRSVAAHTQGIEIPPDLGDPERARRGAGNYDAMCVGCHLAPGMEDSEMRQGLYPQPPNLVMPAERGGAATTSAARQFWITKHGLKMTGMPAWAKSGVDDATIWDIVALLPMLSSLSADEYRELVASSEGHSHAGAQEHGHGKEAAPADTAPAGHMDAPGTPPHDHDDARNHGHAH
jgi:cytochrome c1